MKKTPYAKVWSFLDTMLKFRIFNDSGNSLYLGLAVKAANITRLKYENEIRNRT